MKISILVCNLSNNCLGRAYLLGKVLQRKYAVEVIGPMFGKKIWAPYNQSFKYKMFKVENFSSIFVSLKDMLKTIDGDVIYACKPRLTSFGVALLKRLSCNDLPIVLDIDDWEAFSGRSSKALSSSFFALKNIVTPIDNYLMEFLSHKADERTVASRFLQKKFGGFYVPHGLNTDIYDPTKFDRKKLRLNWNLDDKKVISFIGTPRPHKGLEDLITALNSIKSSKVKLLMTGDYQDSYVQYLLKLGKGKIIFLGLQPIDAEPLFLSMSDLIVLPQRNTNYAKAQVPAKVFTSMAMAKPIIATSVSDLPEILDGCGWIVNPGETQQLASTIKYVFDNSTEAETMGLKARQKCEEKYSWKSLEISLTTVFKKYE